MPEDAVRRAALKLNLRRSLDEEGGKLWTSVDAGAEEGEAEIATASANESITEGSAS